MAIYNEIQIGRVNRFLQKYFGIKGGPPAPQLQSDIGAAIVLFNGVENRYLEGWNRFGAAVTVAANAGNQSAIRFRNPTASHVVAVFEKIVDSNSNAGAVGNVLQIGAAVADLATLNTGVARRLDPRGSQNPVSIVSTTNVAPANVATSILQWQLPAAASNYDLILEDDQEITLLPGDSLQLISGANAVALLSSFIWRERFLEDSELS